MYCCLGVYGVLQKESEMAKSPITPRVKQLPDWPLPTGVSGTKRDAVDEKLVLRLHIRNWRILIYKERR